MFTVTPLGAVPEILYFLYMYVANVATSLWNGLAGNIKTIMNFDSFMSFSFINRCFKMVSQCITKCLHLFFGIIDFIIDFDGHFCHLTVDLFPSLFISFSLLRITVEISSWAFLCNPDCGLVYGAVCIELFHILSLIELTK